MIRFRDKRFLAVAIVVAALVVFVLPAFVAFRYTAPEQRGQFLTRPWRGWGFAYAALAVPGNAELKTSGMALRKADWVFKGTAVDPREVQLLFVKRKQPYAFTHHIDGRTLTTTRGAELPLHLAGPGRGGHRLGPQRHHRRAAGLRDRPGPLRRPRRPDAGGARAAAGRHARPPARRRDATDVAAKDADDPHRRTRSTRRTGSRRSSTSSSR